MEWARFPRNSGHQPKWLRPTLRQQEAAQVVDAVQVTGIAPGAVQVAGTPPRAPTGVAPGVVPGIVPGVAHKPKASLGGPLAAKQVAPGSTAGSPSSIASWHMGTEIP